MPPNVLIIIINMNGDTLLEDCLSSIQEHTSYPEDSYDILITDNGSSDNSFTVVDRYSVDILRNERNLGFSIANNKAIYQNQDYDMYLLLNNDTRVTENWLSNLVDTARNENIGIVGPQLLRPDGSIQSAGVHLPRGENYRENAPKDSFEEEEVDAVLGAAFLIKGDVIDDIGYLDEIFTPGNNEEYDYCDRARESGWNIAVTPQSTVIHKDDATKENMDSEFLYLLIQKNALKYQIMNGNIQSISKELFRHLKHLIGGLLGHPRAQIRPLIQGHYEVLIDLPDLLRKRFNRTKFIPSYYCEDIKDYSQRYKACR